MQPGIQEMKTQVDISIQCQNLVNKDTFSKSDPACIVSMKNPRTGKWQPIGSTEKIDDNLSPQFTQTILCDYRFEEQQHLLFQLYDIDGTGPYTGRIRSCDDLLGQFSCQLGEICGARGQVIKRQLQNCHTLIKKKSYIIIKAEDRGNVADETINFHFRGERLKKMDLFGKSDPYYLIKRKGRSGQWETTHKSEIIKKTLNPSWRPHALHISKFSPTGNHGEAFRVEVYDWDKNSDDDIIGFVDLTIQQIARGVNVPLRHPSKSDRRGNLVVEGVRVVRNYSFFDYIQGGCEISMMVAIDFTGSNGNPRQPGTLHYCQPGYVNDYEAAIRSVGEILSNYDSDKKFPVYGFGARMPTGQVSHCFALNGNPQNPECVGIEGIIQSYHQALQSVQLYGPTWFSQTTQMAMQHACAEPVSQDVQHYSVFLLLTDGALNDLDQTVEAIVAASAAPLSIVIVGVGNADFGAMEFLDADDGLLRSRSGKVAQRDIVQFVPYNKFKQMGYQALAQETLREIPTQMKQYFQSRRITPNPKPQVNVDAMMAMPAQQMMPQAGAGMPGQQMPGQQMPGQPQMMGMPGQQMPGQQQMMGQQMPGQQQMMGQQMPGQQQMMGQQMPGQQMMGMPGQQRMPGQ